MTFSIDATDLSRFNKKLRRFSKRFAEAEQDLFKKGAEDLLRTTVSHASGRPGPRIVTGQYVASFYEEVLPNGFRVANPSPQARRLEHGFYGTDAAGRVYHQPPYPHFLPALQEVRTRFMPEYRRLPLTVWRSTK